jgi:hypothetical protein
MGMKIEMDINAVHVNIPERRKKPRISCQYPATIQGHDANGHKYVEIARLGNLSATGLYLWINRYIEPGEKLFVTVRLRSLLTEEDTPRLATNGIVLRIDPQVDGEYGVAIKFEHYRFL